MRKVEIKTLHPTGKKAILPDHQNKQLVRPTASAKHCSDTTVTGEESGAAETEKEEVPKDLEKGLN